MRGEGEGEGSRVLPYYTTPHYLYILSRSTCKLITHQLLEPRHGIIVIIIK